MTKTLATLAMTGIALFGGAGVANAAPAAGAAIASPSLGCTISSIPYTIVDAVHLDPTGTSRNPLVVAARDLMRSACTGKR